MRCGAGAEQQNRMIGVSLECFGECPAGASGVAGLNQAPPLVVQLGHPRLRLDGRRHHETDAKHEESQSAEHVSWFGKWRTCDAGRSDGPFCVGLAYGFRDPMTGSGRNNRTFVGPDS